MFDHHSTIAHRFFAVVFGFIILCLYSFVENESKILSELACVPYTFTGYMGYFMYIIKSHIGLQIKHRVVCDIHTAISL